MRVNDLETGKFHHIPKIELAPKDGVDVYRWSCTQFPVFVAFAMTVAKSQGQNCKGRVAVYMPVPVFRTLINTQKFAQANLLLSMIFESDVNNKVEESAHVETRRENI